MHCLFSKSPKSGGGLFADVIYKVAHSKFKLISTKQIKLSMWKMQSELLSVHV